MSHWNGERIVRWSPKPMEGYPGWLETDCGCCSGLVWGVEYPTECSTCRGSGRLCLHIKSGTFALYPGGPFAGRQEKVAA